MKLLEVEECLLVSQAMMGEEPRVAEQTTRSTGLVPRAKKRNRPTAEKRGGIKRAFFVVYFPIF